MGKKYIQSVRGTHDLIGDEMRLFRYIVDQAREIASLFGFHEMQTPIFEFSDVFHRSLGDTSDVVSKETYTFNDRGGESLTLRPEFTAAIVRAFISNGYTQQLPFKAFYAGPAFRYERPQKGRQRQFHQVGVECLGAGAPWQDAEAIGCAWVFLCSVLGNDAIASCDISVEINTLGDDESRTNYRDALVDYLSKYKDDLSEESQIRLEKNPLRILDSKQAEDQEIIKGAPVFSDYLTYDAQANFDKVLQFLKDLPIRVSQRLVRGLDYYSHTVFEFTTTKLGAQSTVLAGGRYNKLVEQMGGPAVAGVGWASGVERLMLLHQFYHEKHSQTRSAFIVLCVDDSDDALLYALSHAMILRTAHIKTELIVQRNVSKGLKKALNMNATYFCYVGSNELQSGLFTVKDLMAKSEIEVSALSDFVNVFKNN